MASHQRLLVPSLLLACVTAAACSSNSPRPSPAPTTGGSGGAGGEGGSTGGSPGGASGSGGSGAGGSATGGSSGGGGSSGSGGATGGSGGGAHDAGPVDAAPPAGDGGPGALPPGTRVVYVLHDAMAGGSANDPSRKSLVDMLNSMHDSHGIVVKMADSPTPAAMMPDAALIIVGPNASMFEHHPAPDLKTVAVPLMVSKDGHTDEIGLGSVQNTDKIYNTIHIIKTDHP